jgi:hypothetical protein
MVKEFNSKGELTSYALSIGCIQTVTINNHRVQLYKEHNCFHVRFFFDTPDDFKRLSWESTSKLTEARKLYKECIKRIPKDTSNAQ